MIVMNNHQAQSSQSPAPRLAHSDTDKSPLLTGAEVIPPPARRSRPQSVLDGDFAPSSLFTRRPSGNPDDEGYRNLAETLLIISARDLFNARQRGDADAAQKIERWFRGQSNSRMPFLLVFNLIWGGEFDNICEKTLAEAIIKSPQRLADMALPSPSADYLDHLSSTGSIKKKSDIARH